MFPAIRKLTVVILILALVVLVFLAVLSIWDVLDDEITKKSIYSMGVISFSSVLVIVGTLIGEGREDILGSRKSKKKFSIGRIILWIVIAYLVLQVFGLFGAFVFRGMF